MSAKRKPARTRIRRDLRRLGLGVLQIESRAKTQTEYERRNAVVTKLIEDAQIEVLRALKSGAVRLEQLVDLDRRNELTGSQILGRVAMRAPLWETWEERLALMGTKASTRKRYEVSMRQLRGALPSGLTVGGLLAVEWGKLSANWPGSASDWNNVRHAVSTLLTSVLGDKYHPMRRQIVSRIPIQKESPRVPDLSPAVFWRVVDAARPDVRPVYITLAGTGLRVRSEYLAMEDTDLMPATHQLRVPDDGKKGSRIVSVAPELWEYVTLAIPAKLQYKRLRELWIEACRKAEVSGITLHDLRHAHAQWATDFGAQLSQVQGQLRHTTPLMTARYAKQKDSRAVASAAGAALRRVP